MPSLIGILLDVSGSMRLNVGDGIDEKGGPWARSIFEVINNFIKHDVSSDNHVFAIGFGADRPGEEIFDIIGTLQQPVTLDHINMMFEILERAGAPYHSQVGRGRSGQKCIKGLYGCLVPEKVSV